jgi:hypothetical protein
MALWTKVLWLAAILVFPLIGAAAFVFYGYRRGPVDETAKWSDRSAEEIQEAAYHASHMSVTDRRDPLL